MRKSHNILSLFCLILSLLIVNSSIAQNQQQLYVSAMRLKESGKNQRAIKAFEKALEVSIKQEDISTQMKCHLELAELQNNIVSYKKALDNYQSFTQLYKQTLTNRANRLKDSVERLKWEAELDKLEIKEQRHDIVEKSLTIEDNIGTIDHLLSNQLRATLKVKNLELKNQRAARKLERENNEKNILLLVLALGLLLLFFVVFGYFRKRQSAQVLSLKNEEIAFEKDKSDRLLLNILPSSVAEELKEHGKTSSFHYEEVTVMFTDFKGFTAFAEQNSPEDVVSMLDFYFRGFDNIISRYSIEKIKTIGDAYLCVSGAPEPTTSHAKIMVQAAIEFQQFVKDNQDKKFGIGSELLEMRIGLHTGPIVAGVVGSMKFAYDVWGDTVNIAARMEQSGEIGKINVSETVVAACGESFGFTYRGELEAKNKGLLKMYFVEG